jgi:hypothetical protein
MIDNVDQNIRVLKSEYSFLKPHRDNEGGEKSN